MKRLISITAILLILLAMVSCYYDNEETLYPTIDTTCDTTNVTYSGTIVPILSDNCYSCHSNASAPANGSGIPLQNYSDVASRASSVSGAMRHTGGYSPMPKNGGKLKECYLTQFDLWVQKGMPNN